VLWALADDPALSSESRAAVTDPDNEVYVSAASAWEVEIKRALGKLEAPDELLTAIAATGFDTLPITPEHAVEAGRLPPHHYDPFDRLLVAQGRLEQLVVVTRDPEISRYEVSTLRAS